MNLKHLEKLFYGALEYVDYIEIPTEEEMLKAVEIEVINLYGKKIVIIHTDLDVIYFLEKWQLRALEYNCVEILSDLERK